MQIFETAHAWAAGAAAVLTGVAVILGLLDGAGILHVRRLLDRLVIAVVVLLGIAAFLGPLLLIAVRPPTDMLHLLYAVLAIVAMPLARLESMRRRSTHAGWWIAAGGVITLAALVRLWATGA
jgi:hypothetical protein